MRVENSFIPVRGVGEKTERRLWRDGIRDWEAFEEHGPLSGKRRNRTMEYIEEARFALRSKDAEFFVRRHPDSEAWRVSRTFEEDACFFDIETTGLDCNRNKITVVSFHMDTETTTLVRGDDLTPGNVESVLQEAGMLVSYNGKRFDAPFLEADLGLDVDTPHLDLMYMCRRLGMTGGLKTVEKELGIGRNGVEDIDGREAVRLWYAYEDGDTDALERLIEYNRYDTCNLRTLLSETHDMLHERVFAGER